MSIYVDLVKLTVCEMKKTGTARPWAVRSPDRKRGYWTQRLQGKILRRLRYQRMYARRKPRVHNVPKDRRYVRP